MSENKTLNTMDIAFIGVFTALLAICSWINIPLIIPISLQTFAVALISLYLNRKQSMFVYFVYFILGIFGVPVFAGFKSGFSVIMGPTGGYLLGFILMTVLSDTMLGLKEKTNKWKFTSLMAGLVLCYFCAVLWYKMVYFKENTATTWLGAISVCVLPYIIPDIAKLWLAIFVDKKLKKQSLKNENQEGKDGKQEESDGHSH